jgi:TM2 domain-containing membrane protein YozV
VKDRVVAATLAFVLGVFGIHRFYLEESGAGCLYLFLAFTFPPATLIAGWIEGIMLLTMSQDEFHRRYNYRFLGEPAYAPRPRRRTRVTVRRVVIGPDGERHEVVEEYDSRDEDVAADPRYAPSDDQIRLRAERQRREGRQPEYGRRRPQSPDERDRFVLQAARDSGGLLTPSDLSMMTQLSLRESKAALDELHRQQVCELEVDDAGLVRYVFPEFVPQDDSHRRMRGERADSDVWEDLDAT